MTRREKSRLSLMGTVGILIALVSFPLSTPAWDASPGDSAEVSEGPLLFEAPTAGRLGRSVQAKPADDAQPAAQANVDADAKSPAGGESAAETTESATVEPEKPVLPPLSAEMVALGERARRAVAQLYSRRPNTGENTPDQIIDFCLAFGADAEVVAAGSSRRSVNAVGSLCWNFPCGGYQLLRTVDGQTLARVGYGLERRPGQLLAMLAEVGVPADYELRVGDHQGTVADLIDSEKKSCRSGTDLSFKLTGLSFYVKPEASWTDSVGGEWSLERLLREELDRTADRGTVDAIDRLVGLANAASRCADASGEMRKLVGRAREHVAKYQQYALKLQNSDGSWHPGFFAYRGTSKDATGTLYASGHILAWLVETLPEEDLGDAGIAGGVDYLVRGVSGYPSRRGLSSMTTREIDAVMHAARALALYNVRYLAPRTPEPPATEKAAASAAGVRRASPR